MVMFSRFATGDAGRDGFLLSELLGTPELGRGRPPLGRGVPPRLARTFRRSSFTDGMFFFLSEKSCIYLIGKLDNGLEDFLNGGNTVKYL